MKIHMRLLPPMPFVPPPKPPPTAFQLEMQAEELVTQQQKARLKKQFSAQRTGRNLDEDTDSENGDAGLRSNRNFDVLA